MSEQFHNQRVSVEPTLNVIGRDHIYAVGDLAYLEDSNGQPYPQLIPVAQQQGTLAAKNILRQLKGEKQVAFRYFDRGIRATIWSRTSSGRRRQKIEAPMSEKG